MKKVILCPLLSAVATLSIHAPAHSEPAPAQPVIEIPATIDPANIDDQKLSEMIETIRASRNAAIHTLGDRTLDVTGGDLVVAGGLTASGGALAARATKGILLKAASSSSLSRKKALLKALKGTSAELRGWSGIFLGVSAIALSTGLYIKLDEWMNQPKINGKDALLLQNGGDLDAILKHDNKEIVAVANQDANLKKHIVNIYQAIMLINEPAAT